MRTQTTSLVLIASAALFSCGKATQPKPACRAQNAEYAARYLDEPEVVGGACDGKILKGEVLHLTYYRMTPTGGIPKLAIEPATIADAVAHAEEADPAVEVEHAPEEFSLGSFKSDEPDDKDICTAATLSEAGVKVPEIPANMMMMTDAHPAVDVSYKWSNVRFVTQPLSNAIHFGADLERRDGDCVVKYKVSGINPVIPCGNGMKPKVDEMGNPIPGEMEHDPTTGEPDDENCKASEVGAAEGTGLSPYYTYQCAPDILICTPKAAFPSLAK